MPAPTTVAQLLELIEKSEVLDSRLLTEHLSQLRSRNDEPRTPADMAEALRNAGVLTRFQAQQFLQGKWRNFIISGKYVLLDTLGAGGMANVFLCEHRIMRRKVALKVLPNAMAADLSSVERFHREARAVARLDHPNIVRAHDVDKEGKLHFLVMEYVEGNNLHYLVTRQGRLEVARACDYARQAALGLAHAHAAGIVHRDIKPGNLLIDRQGVVKILDMGLARLFDDHTEHLTREHDSEAVLGTADFLAPEQVVDSHAVDHRADIYSLGLTLYFMLAGRGPFDEGTVAQKLIWHQTREPKPITEFRPDVPPEVLAILNRMTAKTPDERFQNASELAQALLPWAQPGSSGSGGLVRAESAAELPKSADSAERAARAGPLMPTGSSAQLNRPQPASAKLAKTPPRSPARLPSVSAATPIPVRDLELTLEPAENDQRERPDRKGTRAAVTSPPSPARETRKTPEEATIADLAGRKPVPPPSSRKQRVVAGAPTARSQRRLAEEESQLAESMEEEVPRRRSLVTVAALLLVAAASGLLGYTYLAPSPGVEKGRAEQALPLANAQAVRKPPAVPGPKSPLPVKKFEENPLVATLLTGHSLPVTRAVLLRQGSLALSADAGGEIRLWNVRTRELVRKFAGVASTVLGLAASPDGRLVAASSQDGLVRIWQLDTGVLIHSLRHPEPVQSLTFTLDSRGLLCGARDLILYALSGAKTSTHFSGHQLAVTSLTPLPNGRQVASTSLDGSVRVWDLDSTEPLWSADTAHAGGVTAVDCSPSGRYLATGGNDNLLRLWDAESGQLIRTFAGHTGAITGVAFVKDGERVLTSSVDRTIRVWDIIDGKQVGEELRGHGDTVTAVSTVAAGKVFLSASADRTVCLWNYPAFSPFQGELRRFTGHTAQVETVALSPDGHHLATGSNDRTIRLWDLDTGSPIREFKGHTGTVLNVAFSPDGQLLLSGGGDKTVRLWKVATGQQERELKGPTGTVYSVRFSPDGELALAGSYDRCFHLWRVATGEYLGATEAHSTHIWTASFSPDAELIATTGNDRVVRLWDPWTGERLRELTGHEDAVRRLAFSPDGKRILTGSFDGTMRLWNRDPARGLRKFDAGAHYVECVAFSPDGRCAASSEGPVIKGKQSPVKDHGIRIWDLATGKQLYRFGGVPGKIFQIAFTPDGRHVVGGCEDRMARLWRLPPLPGTTNSGELRLYYGHKREVEAVALSPDGRQMCSAARDGTLRVWNFHNSKLHRDLETKGEPVCSIIFSPDGKTVLTGGKDKIARLWDLATGKEQLPLVGHRGAVNGVLFTPDGERILTCSDDRSARLWERKTGRLIREFAVHRQPVTGIALSPDGRQLLTASLDKTVRVWEVDSGKILRTYNRHDAGVKAVALSPDGRLVLSGDADGQVYLWEVQTGRTLGALTDHRGAITSVAFTPDGQRLLTGSADGTLRIWDKRLRLPQAVYSAAGEVTGLVVTNDGRHVLCSSLSWQPRLFGLPPVE